MPNNGNELAKDMRLETPYPAMQFDTACIDIMLINSRTYEAFPIHLAEASVNPF